MARVKKRVPRKAAQRKAAQRKAAPRKAARKAPRAVAGPRAAERDVLVRRIAEALGIPPEEALLRALRELAERVAPPKPSRPDPAHVQAEKLHAPPGALPERLYLLLDGRGLDGRGMPVEAIDVPTVVGSERHCTVWVNSPQIETRHLQFTREDADWYLEDLGSTHGTFLGDQRITRRRVKHGDEYRLAGYLRLRIELR